MKMEGGEMNKTLQLFSLGIAISGCASFNDMSKGLDRLMHKDIKTAISVLGRPSNKIEHNNHTQYIWQVKSTGEIVYAYNTHYGVGYSSMPATYKCEINIYASKSDKITYWAYDGNYGDCRRYMKRLKEYDGAEKQTN